MPEAVCSIQVSSELCNEGWSLLPEPQVESIIRSSLSGYDVSPLLFFFSPTILSSFWLFAEELEEVMTCLLWLPTPVQTCLTDENPTVSVLDVMAGPLSNQRLHPARMTPAAWGLLKVAAGNGPSWPCCVCSLSRPGVTDHAGSFRLLWAEVLDGWLVSVAEMQET